MIKQIVRTIEDGVNDDVNVMILREYEYFMLPYLTRLDNLRVIDCGYNDLIFINDLPERLEELYCEGNSIIDLELPDSLKVLCCNKNEISYISLPPNLEVLDANDCKINLIVKIPKKLRTMRVKNNFLTHIPECPKGLRILDCSGNYIKNIKINDELKVLNIANNVLIEIIEGGCRSLKKLNAYGTKVIRYNKNLRGVEELVVSKDSEFISPLIKGEIMNITIDMIYESAIIVILRFIKNILIPRGKERNEKRKKICASIREFSMREPDRFHILEICRKRIFKEKEE